jgi:hypothetical protein
MAKTGWLFLNLNANHFADGGGDEVDIFLDGSGGLTSTASGIGIDALGVTNGMLAGSDGSVPFTADQPMGSNKVTGLAPGVAATDAVNLNQLQSAVSGLQWKDPVYCRDYLGTRTVAEIDALTPNAGDSVVAGSAGTPSAGTSDAVAIGDVTQFDGTSWINLVTNVGGFVPDGTRLLVHDDTETLFAPLTEAADESKIAEFDGTSNTPSSLIAPVDGDAILVNGDGSVNENKGYVFDTNQTPDAWVQFTGTGGVTDHGALTGLGDDDHLQYALLAGRSGGQVLIGGTDASDNLDLQSTSNATRGAIRALDNFEWQGQVYQDAINVLADGANIATDCDDGNIHQVTLAGNRTLDNPTNLQVGTYVWRIVQDGTGSRTLTFGTAFNFAGGGTPVLSSTPGAVDIITGISNGAELQCSIMTEDDLGVATHASTHIRGGSDEIDGDLLDIDATPDNYTPTTAATGGQTNPATNVDELAAHLIGIDNALGAVNPTVPAPYWHTLTAAEVNTNGYITLTSTPSAPGKVSVYPEGGPVQINDVTKASGMTPDYTVGVDNTADPTALSISNAGAMSTLSGDLAVVGLNLYIVFEG